MRKPAVTRDSHDTEMRILAGEMRELHANGDFLRAGKRAWKKLLLMKLLSSFYVFTCEGTAKLYVAEKDDHYECP
jgi:hypothetical protein